MLLAMGRRYDRLNKMWKCKSTAFSYTLKKLNILFFLKTVTQGREAEKLGLRAVDY